MHYPVVVLGGLSESRAALTEKACRAMRGDWADEGGRFQGLLDGYDPQANPENIEDCDLCNGTGIRPGGREQFGEEWFISVNGCNGCLGEGKRCVWSTEYVPHDEWLVGEAILTPVHVPCVVVLPDGQLVEIEEDDLAVGRDEYRAAVEPWAREGYRATVADVHI